MKIMKLCGLLLFVVTVISVEAQPNSVWRKKMREMKLEMPGVGPIGSFVTTSIEDRMIKKGEKVDICVKFDPKYYSNMFIPGLKEISKEELAVGLWFVTIAPDSTVKYELKMVSSSGHRTETRIVEVIVADKNNVLTHERPILVGLSTYEPVKPGESVEILIVFDPARVQKLSVIGIGEASKELLTKGEWRFTVKPEKTMTYLIKAKIAYNGNKQIIDREYFIEIPVKAK